MFGDLPCQAEPIREDLPIVFVAEDFDGAAMSHHRLQRSNSASNDLVPKVYHWTKVYDLAQTQQRRFRDTACRRASRTCTPTAAALRQLHRHVFKETSYVST